METLAYFIPIVNRLVISLPTDIVFIWLRIESQVRSYCWRREFSSYLYTTPRCENHVYKEEPAHEEFRLGNNNKKRAYIMELRFKLILLGKLLLFLPNFEPKTCCNRACPFYIYRNFYVYIFLSIPIKDSFHAPTLFSPRKVRALPKRSYEGERFLYN